MAADAAGATHAGWLQMRGGALRRWQNRYFALFPPGAFDAPALRFKALPGDAAWAGVLPLDGVSAGALPLGDGHPSAACFYIHRQGKTYVLAASSEAEVQRWLACIADELRSALAVAARRSAESPRPAPRAALPWLGASVGESCDGGASMSEAVLTDDDAGSEVGSPTAAAAAAGAEVRALNGVWRGVLAARESVLQEALRAAEGERARAERAAMRAEEDRAALLAAAREQRAAATRWRGAARRALVRCAVVDAARATAEAQLAAERAAREAEAAAAREAAEAAEAAQRAAMAEEAERAERRAAADAEDAKATAEAAARRLAALLFADAATAHWWRGPQACADGGSVEDAG